MKRHCFIGMIILGVLLSVIAVAATINLPANLENVMEKAFYGNSAIVDVVVPDGTHTIGSKAFAECSALVRVTIPSSVISIADDAFNGSDDVLVLCPSGSYAESYAKRLNIAYQNTDLPVIGDYQYTYRADTQDIMIDKYLGTDTVITIPDKLDGKPVTCIGESAFLGNETLESVTVPSSVTSILASAFDSCSNLSSLTLLEGLESISSYAFSSTGVTTVEIPASVISCESDAFRWCANLTSYSVASASSYYKTVQGVLFSKDGAALVAYPAGKSGVAYAIPEGTQELLYAAFCACEVDTLSLPTNAMAFDSNAFIDSNLKTIIVPDNNPSFKAIDGVLFAKRGDALDLFYYPGRRQGAYVVPSGVEIIKSGAIWNTAITSLKLPSSVTELEVLAIAHNYSLTSLTGSRKLITFGEDAIYGCDAVTIRCYEDSALHQYAIANHLDYSLVESLSLNMDRFSLTVGGIDVLFTSDSNGEPITWASSNTSVVAVDQYGVLDAIAAGKAIITASTDSETAQCEVAVVQPIEITVAPDRAKAATSERVTWAVVKTNGGSNVEYQFSLYRDNQLVDKTEYQSESSYTYIPTKTGEYSLNARALDETGTYVSCISNVVAVTSSEIGTATLTSSATSVTAGSNVTLFAHKSAGGSYALSYRYVIKRDGMVVYDVTSMANEMKFVLTSIGSYEANVYIEDSYQNTVQSSALEIKVLPIDIVFDNVVGRITDDVFQFTFSTSGGYGEILFSYELYRNNVLWATSDETNDCFFTYTISEPGTYGIHILAKDASGATALYVDDTFAYNAEELVINAVTVASDVCIVGQPIKWSTDYHGGNLASLSFRYDVFLDEICIDSIFSDDTCSYTPNRAGTYKVTVTVSDDTLSYIYADAGACVVNDASKPMIESIIPSTLLTPPGVAIHWTVTAYDGVGTLQYAFDIYEDDALLQEGVYGPLNSYSYTPDQIGTYHCVIRVIDQNSSIVSLASVQTIVSSAITLQSFTPEQSSTTANTPALFTALVVGGVSPYSYKYQITQNSIEIDTFLVDDIGTMSYVFSDAGMYDIKVTVTDSVGSTATGVIDNYTVTNAVEEFRILTPTAGEVLPLTGTYTISWTALADAVKYDVALFDTTLNPSCTEHDSTTNHFVTEPEWRLGKSMFDPGHNYRFTANALNASSSVIASAEVSFSADPAALGTYLYIVFPSSEETLEEIGYIETEVEISIGQGQIICEPVVNATYYYAVITKTSDSSDTYTTPRTSSPYIVIPAGLRSGNRYKVRAYAGNDKSSVSSSYRYFEAYPDDEIICINHHFSSLGGSVKLSTSCSATRTWTASTNAGWVTLSSNSGTGPSTVTVTVQPNTTGFNRTAIVDLSSNSDDVESYILTQSAYEVDEVKPIPSIQDFEKEDERYFCEEVDGDIDELRVSGIINANGGQLASVRVVLRNVDSTTGYVLYEAQPNASSFNLSVVPALDMAATYRDKYATELDLTKPGEYRLEIHAQNKNGTSNIIAVRKVYLHRDIRSMSIIPDNSMPKLNDRVTWNISYTGGGPGVLLRYRLYHNGELVDTTKWGTSTSYTERLDKYGRYVLTVIYECGSMVASYDSDALLLLDSSSSYIEPVIRTATVSDTAITTGESVTWTVSARYGIKPYQYKWVVKREGSNGQYKYINFDEGGDSLTLALDTAGSYAATAYVKDSCGTIVSKVCPVVMVTNAVVVTNPLKITYPENNSTLERGDIKLRWNEYKYDYAYYKVTLINMTTLREIGNFSQEQIIIPECPVDEDYLTSGHRYQFKLGVYNASNALIRETSVLFTVGGTYTPEDPEDPEEPDEPNEPTIEIGVVNVTNPINGSTVAMTDMNIQWITYEDAVKYQVLLQDLTENPDNATSDGYVVNNYVSSGTSYMVYQSQLKAGHEYRLLIGAYNNANQQIAGKLTQFSVSCEQPTICDRLSHSINMNKETLVVGQSFYMSGSVNSSNGELKQVRIQLTDTTVNPWKTIDYAICGKDYILANGGSSSSFDLSHINMISTGDNPVGESGGTGNTITMNLVGGTYILTYRATGSDGQEQILGSKEIRLTGAPFIKFRAINGSISQDITSLELPYTGVYNGQIAIYTNCEKPKITPTNWLQLKQHDTVVTSDGYMLVYDVVKTENPYATAREDSMIVSVQGSSLWNTLIISQSRNPNVPIVTSAALDDDGVTFHQNNPLKMIVGDHNYKNGFALIVNTANGVTADWYIYSDNTSVADAYRGDDGLYYVIAKSIGRANLFLSHVCSDKYSIIDSSLLYALCAIEVNSEGGKPIHRSLCIGAGVEGDNTRQFESAILMNNTIGDTGIYHYRMALNASEPEEVLDGIKTHFVETDSNDYSIIYIHAHGGLSANGVPIMAIGKNDSSHYLDVNKFAQTINDKVRGNVLVVIESCHSGAFIESFRAVDKGKRITVLVACGTDESSIGNVYTQNVAQAIQYNHAISIQALFAQSYKSTTKWCMNRMNECDVLQGREWVVKYVIECMFIPTVLPFHLYTDINEFNNVVKEFYYPSYNYINGGLRFFE